MKRPNALPFGLNPNFRGCCNLSIVRGLFIKDEARIELSCHSDATVSKRPFSGNLLAKPAQRLESRVVCCFGAPRAGACLPTS